MSSLLIASPFLVLGLLSWPLFRGGDQRRQNTVGLRLYVATAAISSVVLFAVMLTFAAQSRRYAHDFIVPWMIVVFAGVACFGEKGIRWRPWLPAGSAVVAASAVLHAHLCFTRPEPPDINVMRTFVALSPLARYFLPEGPKWDREEAIARNDLGTIYMKEKRFQAALEQFEKAAELMPDEPRIERNVQLARRLARGGG